jgi:signal transduction histidine kinase
MSRLFEQHYQQLQWRLTAIFSLTILLLIIIYTGVIVLSHLTGKVGFERSIEERFPNDQNEPSSRDWSYFGESKITILQFDQRRGQMISVPMVVQRNLLTFLKKTFYSLIILDVLLWVIGTTSGYFFIAWLLLPGKKQARSQEEFLANASHELKTPITTIKTELALLEKEKVTDEVRESLVVIKSENLSLQNLVMKLLLATASQEVKLERLEVTALVQGRLRAHQKNYQAKKITFKYAGPKSLVMISDRGKLEQVLDLLLDNAGKYSEVESEVRLVIEVIEGKVVIRVINRGLGISESERKKVFKRFYRVTSRRVQAENGSGLGLAIALDLVKELKGKLELESGRRERTCFKLTLPVRGV